MNIVKLCGFALAAAMLAFALKAGDKQLSLCLALSAGAMLLIAVLSSMEKVLEMLLALSGAAGLKSDTLSLIIKLMGMAYITEFGVQACRDADQEGIAMKLSLCGKMAMVVLTLPLLSELSTLVFSLVP